MWLDYPAPFQLKAPLGILTPGPFAGPFRIPILLFPGGEKMSYVGKYHNFTGDVADNVELSELKPEIIRLNSPYLPALGTFAYPVGTAP